MSTPEDRLTVAMRPQYTYQVMSGAAHYGNPFARLSSARLFAQKVANAPHDGPLEIERVLQLPGGARRYWVMRGAKWVPWRGDMGSPIERKAWCVE